MTTHDVRERQADLDDDHPVGSIEADHRSLRGRLDELSAAKAATALLSALRPLPKVLQEHFDREEQNEGLYEDLRMRRPSLAPKLDELSSEHGVMMAELEEVRRGIESQLEKGEHGEEIAEPMLRDIARWVERLRRHEHDESRMIGDVYYTDEGGIG